MSDLMLQSATRDLPLTGTPAGPSTGDSLRIVQRKSTFAEPAGPALTAPAITDAGRPIDADTRSAMESGFGRSFADVRIHDDARAHDNARALDARAYTAGNDITFAEGAYRPDTASGRALIAHELAHTIQQGGVQAKANGPLPAMVDTRLEAEADRAAAAVSAGGTAPALSRVNVSAVFRSGVGENSVAGSTIKDVPGPVGKLPPGMKEIADPDRAAALVVEVDAFELPLEKGMGTWVQQAYTDAANGGRLVFSPIINGGTIAAYKEGSEDYQSIWLGKYGFSSTKGLATAFNTAKQGNNERVKKAAEEPGVTALITGMATNLKSSKCDIDHIVEKQMGGTSQASNLQLLDKDKNQSSGRKTYEKLVSLVEQIRSPEFRGTAAGTMQLRLKRATVPAGTSDPSYVVEQLLRDKVLVGSEAVKAKAEGKEVYLDAGGMGETVNVHDSNPTPIDAMSKRLVPGMRVTTYKRGPQGPASKTDTVTGDVDSLAMRRTGNEGKDSAVVLVATLAPSAAATPAPAAGPASSPATTPAAPTTAPIGERRTLSITTGPKNIKFYYPYLSPGEITVLGLDSQGNLTGEAVIHPSPKFLGDLKVVFGKDKFELIKDIDTAQLNQSAFMKPLAPGFRFTEAGLKLDLLKFQPSGFLKFSMGPANKPFLLGDITAKAEGGAFVATGSLTPGGTLPGIKDASGEVSWRSGKGWSGMLKATTSAIPGATTSLKLGFTETPAGMKYSAEGGIGMKVRGADLDLGATWTGSGLSYWGKVSVPKPLPLVESVILAGSYANGVLSLEGRPKARWRGAEADVTVGYKRKDGDEEGKFSGSVAFAYKDEKLDGSITLKLGEAGFSGSGKIAYQINKHFRPGLGVVIGADGRIKLTGTVDVSDITVFDQWPKPPDDRKRILKAGARAQFPVPPLPVVTITLGATGELGVFYSIGPGTITRVKLTASLYPFEEDKQITAKLSGRFSVPAKAGLYGRFGVLIGAAVAGGLVGAEGGIHLAPEIGVKGAGGVDVNADYADGGFAFAADAWAKGSMFGSLGIDFAVNLYAAYGAVSHEWTHPAAKWGPKDIGPELTITLGRIAYARDGTITWPSLSQIDVNPKEFDPISLVKDIMQSSKVTQK